MGNARDDRLAESPLWRRYVGKSHGVFVATGVHEMADVGGARTALWSGGSSASPSSCRGSWDLARGRARVHAREMEDLHPVGEPLRHDDDLARHLEHAEEPAAGSPVQTTWISEPTARYAVGDGTALPRTAAVGVGLAL